MVPVGGASFPTGGPPPLPSRRHLENTGRNQHSYLVGTRASVSFGHSTSTELSLGLACILSPGDDPLCRITQAEFVYCLLQVQGISPGRYYHQHYADRHSEGQGHTTYMSSGLPIGVLELGFVSHPSHQLPRHRVHLSNLFQNTLTRATQLPQLYRKCRL